MDASTKTEPVPPEHATVVERIGDRELTVTRVFNAPPRIVFQAWTQAELFRRWWVPKSFPVKLLSIEMDARVGGGYRLEFGTDQGSAAFFGTYLEVVPPSRLVWTNDEEHGAGAITTVTFTEVDGRTRVVVHDTHPSKEALEEGMGSYQGMPETFDQLSEVLTTLAADAR